MFFSNNKNKISNFDLIKVLFRLIFSNKNIGCNTITVFILITISSLIDHEILHKLDHLIGYSERKITINNLFFKKCFNMLKYNVDSVK